MPSNVPARRRTPIVLDDWPTRRELRAVAARRRAEDGVLTVALQQQFTKEVVRLEAETAADATRDMALREIAVLKELLDQVDGSAAAAKVVGERLEQLSRAGSTILSRRFGI
jgi:hypothetical protein